MKRLSFHVSAVCNRAPGRNTRRPDRKLHYLFYGLNWGVWLQIELNYISRLETFLTVKLPPISFAKLESRSRILFAYRKDLKRAHIVDYVRRTRGIVWWCCPIGNTATYIIHMRHCLVNSAQRASFAAVSYDHDPAFATAAGLKNVSTTTNGNGNVCPISADTSVVRSIWSRCFSKSHAEYTDYKSSLVTSAELISAKKLLLCVVAHKLRRLKDRTLRALTVMYSVSLKWIEK